MNFGVTCFFKRRRVKPSARRVAAETCYTDRLCAAERRRLFPSTLREKGKYRGKGERDNVRIIPRSRGSREKAPVTLRPSARVTMSVSGMRCVRIARDVAGPSDSAPRGCNLSAKSHMIFKNHLSFFIFGESPWD